MLELIIEHQFAFAKNMPISDNVLIAFETLHCIYEKSQFRTNRFYGSKTKHE